MKKENKLPKRIVVADGFPFHIEQGERIIGILTESNSDYSLKIKSYSKELYSVSGFPINKNKKGVKWKQ